MTKKIALPIALILCIGLGPTVGRAEVSLAEKARASLDLYFQAWAESDEAARRALLEQAWADDGTYTDPSAHVEGREALVQHIGDFKSNEQFKGFRIEQSTGIDIHHQSFRFGWEMKDPSGNVVTPGIDYGEFDREGRITKIVGFFGPFPEME